MPQWIGTAIRGESIAAARAARSGSRCPGPEIRAPSPDREQGQVELVGERRHALEEVGVAGEVDPPRTREVESDRLRATRYRRAAVAVHGLHGGDLDLPDLDRLPGSQLRDRGQAAALEKPARSGRGEHGRLGVDRAQRAPVGMVVVEVGDEHRVEPIRHLRAGPGPVAAQVADPRSQHRVGEDAQAVQLEQNRRMPDVGDAIRRFRGVPSSSRRGAGGRRRRRRSARRAAAGSRRRG